MTIETEVRDMRSYVPDRTFDFIVADGCLHLIEREEWLKLIKRLQDATLPSGYHSITVFTDVLPSPYDMAAFTPGLFHEGELFTLYDGWIMHLQESYQFKDEHSGGIKHHHAVNKLVAQKR